jgi:hypothetical protein
MLERLTQLGQLQQLGIGIGKRHLLNPFIQAWPVGRSEWCELCGFRLLVDFLRQRPRLLRLD